MIQNFKKLIWLFLALVCVMMGYIYSSSWKMRNRRPVLCSKTYKKHLPLFKSVNDKNKVTLALEKDMKNCGIEVDASRFDHGYQIIPKTEGVVVHLIKSLQTNDSDKFVKQVIFPLIKEISIQHRIKLFFRSSGSNNNLIAIVNNGIVTYDLFSKDLSKRILNSLNASGFRCTVTKIGIESYHIQLRSALKGKLNQKWTEALSNVKSINPSIILKVSMP